MLPLTAPPPRPIYCCVLLHPPFPIPPRPSAMAMPHTESVAAAPVFATLPKGFYYTSSDDHVLAPQTMRKQPPLFTTVLPFHWGPNYGHSSASNSIQFFLCFFFSFFKGQSITGSCKDCCRGRLHRHILSSSSGP